MNCLDCAWHVVAVYANGEIYDECECENMVLHEDEIVKGCEHFAKERCEE